MTTVFIYILRDPANAEVRYVGKTTMPKRRLRGHLTGCMSRESHAARWLRKLIAGGVEPLMEIVETIENSNDEDWQNRERFWIAHFIQLGCRLTNATDGGIGGLKMSEETRRKMSVAKKGKTKKPFSESHRANLSKAFKGRKPSAIALRRMSEAHLGRKHSEETKRKIGLAHKGILTAKMAEQIKRLAEARRGKKLSAEWREKMRLSHLRRWEKQNRQAVSLKLKAYWTPENREAKSIAMRLTWKQRKQNNEAVHSSN